MIRFFLLSFSLCANLAFAEGEFYSDRPHISQVLPKEKIDEVVPERVFLSQIDFVIELRVLFFNKRRVYLGRDGELMHDIDWLLWKMWGESEELEPQLINISRKSTNSEHLGDYQKAKRLGRKASDEAVISDTGYEGSVVDAINGERKQKGYEPIKAHLISSVHPLSASSRVATQAYLPHDWQWQGKTEEDLKDTFLDLVDQQIEEIEGLPHFTSTATDYRRHPTKGEWDAYSEKEQEAEEKNRSNALQRQLLSYLHKNSPAEKRAKKLCTILIPFMREMQVGNFIKLKPKEIDVEIAKLKFGLFWHDLFEAHTKGTVTLPEGALDLLWGQLPGGKPELFDLEAEEKAKLFGDSAAKISGLSFIETIMDFHKQAKEQLRAKPSSRELEAVRAALAKGKIQLDMGFMVIGKNLGEGARGEVFALGEEHILKVPFEPDDMRYFEVEDRVGRHLAANFKTYGIHVVPVLEKGESGSYLVRKRIPGEALGENIVKHKLSSEQMQRLEILFQNTKRYAEKTGVGLDIKYDNLAWIDNDWHVFDTGPRTSYGPYAFSLDIPDFATFYRLWQEDSPRRHAVTIESVVANIHARGLTCEGMFLN